MTRRQIVREVAAELVAAAVNLVLAVAAILWVEAKRRSRTLAALERVITFGLALSALIIATVAMPVGHVRHGIPLPPPAVVAGSFTPICDQPVLVSPFTYSGATGSYSSGTAGLPTFGSAGTNFPNATAGTVMSTGSTAGIGGAANTVYFLEAGTYNGLSVSYSNGDVFVGASGGTTLDGGSPSSGSIYAFLGNGVAGKNNGTVEYLTVQHYRPDQGEGAMSFTYENGWNINHVTSQDNYYGGGIWTGSQSTISYSCIRRNGQQGFGTFYGGTSPDSLTGGSKNVTVTNSEIAYNDTCNWENQAHFPITIPAQCGSPGPGFNGCGCSGGGKFWATNGGTFTNNYVHNDYAAGIWYDTDDVGMDVENNYFANEWAGALIMEISYNALISNNTFLDNGWGGGGNSTDLGQASAILLHNASGDSNVAGFHSGSITITNNTMTDNWEGVIELMEGGRFCNNPGFPEFGSHCTLDNLSTYFQQTNTTATTGCGKNNLATNGASLGSSVWKNGAITGGPPAADYYDGCIWADQNTAVTNNTISFHPANITGGYAWTACVPSTVGAANNWCGVNSDFAYFDGGNVWGTGSIYGANWEAWVVNSAANPTGSGNTWDNNSYFGTSQIFDYAQQSPGGNVTFATWQGHSLDVHSTMGA